MLKYYPFRRYQDVPEVPYVQIVPILHKISKILSAILNGLSDDINKNNEVSKETKNHYYKTFFRASRIFERALNENNLDLSMHNLLYFFQLTEFLKLCQETSYVIGVVRLAMKIAHEYDCSIVGTAAFANLASFGQIFIDYYMDNKGDDGFNKVFTSIVNKLEKNTFQAPQLNDWKKLTKKISQRLTEAQITSLLIHSEDVKVHNELISKQKKRGTTTEKDEFVAAGEFAFLKIVMAKEKSLHLELAAISASLCLVRGNFNLFFIAYLNLFYSCHICKG